MNTSSGEALGDLRGGVRGFKRTVAPAIGNWLATQVDQSATRASLGLSTSRRLAAVLGGTLTLEAGTTGGCTFLFRLPRTLPERV